jgi:hypothetical protein
VVTLEFPNPSRSFDEERNAVRFIGHDGMFEVRFFVEVEALAKSNAELRSKTASEGAYLAAFDAARSAVLDVARKAYSRDRRNSLTLTVENFR